LYQVYSEELFIEYVFNDHTQYLRVKCAKLYIYANKRTITPNTHVLTYINNISNSSNY